jgi:NADH-quinone oxidoreductase subunit E
MAAKSCGCAEDILDPGKLESIVRCRRNDGGDLFEILRETQEILGYLPEPALERIAAALGLPVSKIYGIVTFYDEFYLEPHGRNMVRVCRGSACAARGAKDIVRTAQKSLGLKDGETGPDLAFTFETTACFGNCALAPVMTINKTIYGDLTDERVESLLDGLKSKAPSGRS